MSNDLAVSMDELEQESAELLPSRETLLRLQRGRSHGGNSVTHQLPTATRCRAAAQHVVLNGDFVNILSIANML